MALGGNGVDVVVQGTFTALGSAPITAGGFRLAALRMGPLTAPGIFFGSGAPSITAPKGSLYLRTDGTTVSDRMYVNTDSAATWTAVTTVA